MPLCLDSYLEVFCQLEHVLCTYELDLQWAI